MPLLSRWYELNSGHHWAWVPKNACTSIGEHKKSPDKVTQNLTNTIAVIRNPYDRLVSAYEHEHNSTISKMSWEELINYVCHVSDMSHDKHVKSQESFLRPFPEKLIRFENINEEFEKLGITLNRRNKSERKDWREYYSEGDLSRIGDRYWRDFQLWQAATP